MDAASGSSHVPPARGLSELEELQRQHGEKTLKIQELKGEIHSLKLRLEQRKKGGVSDEKMEAFKKLSETYNNLREEYNTLLAEKSREHEK